ncbi:MAG TPA: AI-2E family transporter [Acidimicrobiia bacterium]|nr:AI-2E family transporter [Acidimicrobiia bacterium]
MAATDGDVLRVRIRARTIALLLGAIVLAFALERLFVAAHDAIGWFVAATIVALLLMPVVALLERFMRRALAIAVVLLVLAGFIGVVVYGVFNDLSSQMRRLERAVPSAAARLEDDDRFGEVARDFRLEERARDAVDGIGERLTGEARATAGSVGAYLAGTVLTIFMLGWSTRMMAAGLAQIDDLERRARVRTILVEALRTWRTYVTYAIAQAFGFGCLTFAVCRLADLPAPVPLALWLALWSIVPFIGVLVGMVPILMLSAGLESFDQALVLLAVFLVLQVVQVVILRRVHLRSLYVGPAVVLVIGLLGYEMYAIGGAIFGITIAILALAFADAATTEEPDPEALDPTRPDPAIAPS